MSLALNIQLVIFDWAGTTIDFGCFAPTDAFIRGFAAFGIAVTIDEVRGPMGQHKRDHVRAMFQHADIANRWRSTNNREWCESDVEAVYEEVGRLQLAAIPANCSLVPGLLSVIDSLRSRGLKIAGNTGYFREAAEICYRIALQQGYQPDYMICADEVPQGRPAPWMVFRAMEALNIYPSAKVIKVGDTVADVHEGCNAGAWSVAVTDSSSEMGLTLDEWTRLTEVERDSRRSAIRDKMFQAGAHAVIYTLSELPSLIDIINHSMSSGGKFVVPTRLQYPTTSH